MSLFKRLQEVIKQVRILEVEKSSQPVVERKKRGIRLTPLLCATIVGLTGFLTSCSESPKGETCGSLSSADNFAKLNWYDSGNSEQVRNLQRNLIAGDLTGKPHAQALCNYVLGNAGETGDGTTGRYGTLTMNAVLEANAEVIKVYNEALKIYNQNPRGMIKPALNLVYDVR